MILSRDIEREIEGQRAIEWMKKKESKREIEPFYIYKPIAYIYFFFSKNFMISSVSWLVFILLNV